MLPKASRPKINDLKPMRMIGVTNTTSEALTIVQLGDDVKGGESWSVQEVANAPCEEERKWYPTMDIMLPEYASVPGNAEVG